MLIATLKQLWLELSIILLVIIVSGLTGYEIGRQSVNGENQLAMLPKVENKLSESNVISEIDSINGGVDNSSISIIDNTPQETGVPSVSEQRIVFGSVNGTKYYNYGCKSGDRILIENRVYFEDESRAIEAGYEPATNCKF